jgi:DNA repair protein RadC
MTKAIVDIATPLGISVHDHIIVGRGGHAGQPDIGQLRDLQRLSRT